MARGSDQRIELELALFNLTAPDAQPAPAPAAAQASPAPAARPQPAAQPQPAVRPFASGPVPAPSAEAPAAQPAPQPVPAAEAQPDPANLPPWDEPSQTPPPPAEAAPARDEPLPPPPAEEEAAPPPVEDAPAAQPAFAADPQLDKPRRVAGRDINPYPQWPEVVDRIRDTDPMLYGYLKKSKAYFDGVRVLIDGGKTFRDFIRVNKGSQRLIKKADRRRVGHRGAHRPLRA